MKRYTAAKSDRRRVLTTFAAAAGVANMPPLISRAASASPGIFRFASSDDAAIVTNAGLIEIDPGLPSVGELARRLNHALRERKVVGRIARTKSRFFALGSVTLNAPPSQQLILDFQTTLDRQSEFVSRSFGPLAIDDLPVYVATSLHEDRVVFGAVLDTLAYVTLKSGFWRDAKIIHALDAFCIADAPRKPGALDLIAL